MWHAIVSATSSSDGSSLLPRKRIRNAVHEELNYSSNVFQCQKNWSNFLKRGNYIEELSRTHPHIFLVPLHSNVFRFQSHLVNSISIFVFFSLHYKRIRIRSISFCFLHVAKSWVIGKHLIITKEYFLLRLKQKRINETHSARFNYNLLLLSIKRVTVWASYCCWRWDVRKSN